MKTNGHAQGSRSAKRRLILPGTPEWQAMTDRPLPPAGSSAAVKGETVRRAKKADKKTKAAPKARWTPDYKDPFYSFPRRIVQITPAALHGGFTVLADDGTLWRWDWGARKWFGYPDLPRRPMKE